MSDSQSEFLDTVSQLAASTKAEDAVRVNNSAVASASDPTNTVSLEPNAVFVTTETQNSVNRGAPTTNPPPGIPVLTPIGPPAAPTTNNIPLAMGQGSIINLPSTGPAQIPQSTTTSQGRNVASVTATASAPLTTATSFPLSTVTVPANHFLPNLSAWTFPTGPSNPPVTVTPVTLSATVFPTVLPATSVAPTAREGITSLNGNWPSTVEIHFNGTSGLASSRVPSIQRPLPMT